MAPLNIHPEESATKKRKNNKSLKILLGIGALISIPVIGTTLAAQITIGSGNLNFGQGVQQAAACDNAITVSLASSFDNAQTSGTFNLGNVVATGIAYPDCAGKDFTLSLYGDSDDTAVAKCIVDNFLSSAPSGSTTCATGSTENFSYTPASAAAFSSITAAFTSATPAATSVYKVTIESTE